MKRYALFVSLLLCSLPIAAGAYVTFLAPDPAAEGAAAQMSQDAWQRLRAARVPKLAVDRSEHDFGVLPLETAGTCQFSIRNEGSAPLLLSAPQSALSRLQLTLTDTSLEPQESCVAIVRWSTAPVLESFDSTALVLSNDPARPELQLRVRGQVHADLASFPAKLDLAPISPEKGEVVETLVYSHTWTSFRLANATCSQSLWRCEVRPATEEELRPLRAKCGYHLTVRIPADLPHGVFRETVTVDVARDDLESPSPQHLNLKIPVEGRILRRLALYGEDIEFTGTVNVGVVRQGDTHAARMLMKVRDAQRALPVKRIVCEPEFLEVTVKPAEETGAGSAGHYYLEITVPKDAPLCDYTNLDGHSLGKLRLEFDHPRIPELDLQLYLVVEQKPNQASRQSAR